METFDGSLELPACPASSAGPDFKEVVMGSEGRFGIISEVKVRVTKLARLGVGHLELWEKQNYVPKVKP